MSANGLRPILRTMSETIAYEMRDEILTGRIRPGTRLHQVEIAKQFGVSTTPVREAFALLAQEGLISTRAHKGAVVLGAIEQDVRESFEVRTALETFAVRQAVPNLTDANIAALRELLARYVNIGTVQPEEVQTLVAQFFDQIYVASGNAKLSKSIQDIRGATDVYLLLMATDRPSLCTDRRSETIRLYQAIYLACAARDVDAAVGSIVDHLESTSQAVLSYLHAISADDAIDVEPAPATTT